MTECARCGRTDEQIGHLDTGFAEHGVLCMACADYINEFGQADKPNAAERATDG